MGRKRLVRSGWIGGLSAATIAVVIVAAAGVPGSPANPATPGYVGDPDRTGAPAPLPQPAPWAAVMAVDTPPPERAAGPWPFEPLPPVTKGLELPSPRIAVAFAAPRYDLFTQASVAPFQHRSEDAVAGGLAQVPWLLLPPLAGVALLAQNDGGGGSDGGDGPGDNGDDDPPPGAIVPEPSTWLLMATGLFLLGAVAYRQREGSPGH